MGETFDFEALYHKLKLFDEEAEMSVIGAALLDAEARLALTDALEPQDFLMPRGQTIWAAIRAAMADTATATAFDSLALKDMLGRAGTLDGIGGYDYLVTCMEMCPIVAHGERYASIVRRLSILRALARETGSILEDLRAPEVDAMEVLGRAQERLFRIGHAGNKSGAIRMADLMAHSYGEILEFCRKQDRKTLGLSTGLFDLDKLIGGLQPGHLYVLAGRPSMGKSSLLLRLAEAISAPSAETPVMLYSLEMARSQIGRSMLCSRARLSSRLVSEAKIGNQDLARLEVTAGLLSEHALFCDDSADLSIAAMRANARFMVHKHKIRLIVVDYLQRIRTERRDNRQLEIAHVSDQLKSMAKELNVPVLAAAQLNRTAEHRSDKRPSLADLRESGQIEQDADVVMLLYREGYYFPTVSGENTAELIVAKNRMGPTGSVTLAWMPEFMRFENCSKI